VKVKDGSGNVRIEVDDTGFAFNASAPVAKGTITGARDEPEGALANLLAYLASRGDIINNTTAS